MKSINILTSAGAFYTYCYVVLFLSCQIKADENDILQCYSCYELDSSRGRCLTQSPKLELKTCRNASENRALCYYSTFTYTTDGRVGGQAGCISGWNVNKNPDDIDRPECFLFETHDEHQVNVRVKMDGRMCVCNEDKCNSPSVLGSSIKLSSGQSDAGRVWAGNGIFAIFIGLFVAFIYTQRQWFGQ